MWTYWCVLPYCSGDFKRRLPRTPSTGTMSSADDLDDREPPSPFENGEENFIYSDKHFIYIYLLLVLVFSSSFCSRFK